MARPRKQETIQETTTELRSILFSSIKDVRSGTLKSKDAAQVVGLSKTLIDSARLDMQFAETAHRLSQAGREVKAVNFNKNELTDAENAERIEYERLKLKYGSA